MEYLFFLKKRLISCLIYFNFEHLAIYLSSNFLIIMKNTFTFSNMLRSLSLLLLMFSFAAVEAQTPMFAVGTTTSGSIPYTARNQLPLSAPANARTQILLPVSNVYFPPPLPGHNFQGVPSGQFITRIYFFQHSQGAVTSVTWQNLKIMMGNMPVGTTRSNPPVWWTGSPESPLTTAINRSSFTVTGMSGDAWFGITLDNPVPYDPNKPLLIDISFTATSSVSWGTVYGNSDPQQTQFANPSNASSPSSANPYSHKFGIDVEDILNAPVKVPALANFVYDILTDTAWIGNPYAFVNISNNSIRNYWDVTAYSPTSKDGPFFPWIENRICNDVPNSALGCYLDTTNRNFTKIFNQKGWYKVKLKARGVIEPLDSIEKVVYADYPTQAPEVDFFSNRRELGNYDYVTLTDLSSNGPTQWQWYTTPQCYACQPGVDNSFTSNGTIQNPKFNAYDGGEYDVCLQATNAIGTTTKCKEKYIKIIPGYRMCGGSDSLNVRGEETGGVVLSHIDGLYFPTSVGQCPKGFRISTCADSIHLVLDRYRFRNSDTLDVRINGLEGPVVAKYGGNTFSTIGDSLKTLTIPGGEVFLKMRLTPPNGFPGPFDSGFSMRWYITPASYGAPTASFSAPDTIFSGYELFFKNNSSGQRMSYSWDTDGDGVFGRDQALTLGKVDSISANPSQVFMNETLQPMYKRLGVVVRNCKGSDSALKNIVVMPVTKAPEANFTASRLQGFTSDTFRLFDLTRNGALQWTWTISPSNVLYLEGTTANSQNPVLLLNSETQYSVTLTVTNQLGTNSHTKTNYFSVQAYSSPGTKYQIPSDFDIGINRVVLAEIDTTTPLQSPTYHNLSSRKKATLYRGQTYTVEVYRKTANDPMTTKVWIDLNRNSKFIDAGETLVEEIGQYKVKTSAQFTLPDNAPIGNSRLRIGINYGSNPLSPEVATIGCFEDYGVEVGVDYEKPVLKLKGEAITRMELYKSYHDSGVTATDNLEGDISHKHYVVGKVDTAHVGYYELKYYVSDLYGNISDVVTRIVQVDINRNGPTLVLNGADTFAVEVHNDFIDPNAEAYDNTGKDITENILRTGEFNTDALGYYTLTYTITDAFNYSVTKKRVVWVRDTKKPIIHLFGKNSDPTEVDTIIHQINTPFYDDQYVYVTDEYWKNLIAERTVVGTFDITKPGSYYFQYNVTDGSGNAAITKRILVIIKDKTFPIVRLRGLEEMDIEVFSTFNDPLFDVEGEGTNWIEKPRVSNLDENALGSYEITYTVCDGANNCTSKTRKVNVVDRTAPVIQLIDKDPLVWLRFRPYVDPGATVIDNYYAPSTFIVDIDDSRVIHHQPGDYYVYYNTKDLSGNKAAQEKRLVQVREIDTVWSGVKEFAGADGFIIYPNPSEGKFVVEAKKSTIEMLEIVDITGRVILHKTVSSVKTNVDITAQAKGIYFVKATDKNGYVSIRKITLQ